LNDFYESIEVREWVDEGRISSAQAHKILESNSQAFYGL
jgi:hypothetical protein